MVVRNEVQGQVDAAGDSRRGVQPAPAREQDVLQNADSGVPRQLPDEVVVIEIGRASCRERV